MPLEECFLILSTFLHPQPFHDPSCLSFAFQTQKNALGFSAYSACHQFSIIPVCDARSNPRWKRRDLRVCPFCKVPMDAASSPLFVRLAWSHLSHLATNRATHTWGRRGDQFRSTSIIHLNLNAPSESARAKRRRSCERLQFSPSPEREKEKSDRDLFPVKKAFCFHPANNAVYIFIGRSCRGSERAGCRPKRKHGKRALRNFSCLSWLSERVVLGRKHTRASL